MLEDAKETAPAKSIRELYVYILKYNAPQDPVKLFEEFCKSMGDDFTHEARRGGIELHHSTTWKLEHNDYKIITLYSSAADQVLDKGA